MRGIVPALLIGLITCGCSAPGAAEQLEVSLSNHQVAITSNFVGKDLVLFGTIKPDTARTELRSSYDLVVTVTGPRQTLSTRRKQRVVGIWVNVDSREFVRVPTTTVIGTSMVLTLITMASATVMHAATNHQVDAVLALILMIGGAIGAQFGVRTGQQMRSERLRLLLGILVFAVGLRFAYELVVQPDDLFSIRQLGSE